jgi:hypothetical protein
MTDDAEHMGLMPLIIDGVAHGFAVYGKSFVLLSIELIPPLQGAVQMGGIDTDQDIADGGLAWNDVAILFVTASETFSGLRAEAFGPIRDGLVSTHPTQACSGSNGQNSAQSMASTMEAAWIGDFGKEGG